MNIKYLITSIIVGISHPLSAVVVDSIGTTAAGPSLNLDSITVGSTTFLAADLVTGTASGPVSGGSIAGAGDFDMNTGAGRAGATGAWELRDFGGQTFWSDSNGADVDFFVFEANANDNLTVQAILDDGAGGDLLGNVVTIAQGDGTGWGNLGFILPSPSVGQTLYGAAFSITDLLDENGVALTISSSIKGLRFNDPNLDADSGLDPFGAFAVATIPEPGTYATFLAITVLLISIVRRKHRQ